jgi:hypothetical protein
LAGCASLSVGSGGKLQLARSASPAAAVLSSLSLATGATLDLANHDLRIDYGTGTSPVATVRSDLASGYTGGTWSGSGITTSAADAGHLLGYADSADGVVPGLTPHTILVKYTVPGDTNLDGVVNFSDLLALAQHYGAGNASWDQGDLNYNGTVGFDDLLTLTQHYGNAPASAAAASAVPEPSTVAAGSMMILCLCLRRRSR